MNQKEKEKLIKKLSYKRKELENKEKQITVNRVNLLIKENIDLLKNYKKALLPNSLKKGYLIRYIKLDVPDGKFSKIRTMRVKNIIKKNNDYLIEISTGKKKGWSIYFSKYVVFYKEKSVTEERKDKIEEWKKNNPEEYQKWLDKKKMIDDMKKNDPDKFNKWLDNERKKKNKK